MDHPLHDHPWPSPRLCFQSQVDGPRSQFQATHPARAAHAAMFLRSSVQVPVAPEISWMLILEDQNDPSYINMFNDVQCEKIETTDFWGNLGWSVKTFKYFAMSYQVSNLWKFLVSKSNFWVTKMFWTQHDCAQIHPRQTIISVLSIWQCSKPGTPFHYTNDRTGFPVHGWWSSRTSIGITYYTDTFTLNKPCRITWNHYKTVSTFCSKCYQNLIKIRTLTTKNKNNTIPIYIHTHSHIYIYITVI